MSCELKLVFSGEVLANQHAAVVKGRLQSLLKASDEQADMMFSGRAVVIRRASDAAEAERYRAAFEKAGAVLDVVSETDGAGAEAETTSDATEASSSSATNTTDFVLAALGADLAPPSEQTAQVADIATGHLSLAFPGVDLLDATDEPEAFEIPATTQFDLGELGAMIGASTSDQQELLQSHVFEVDFDLAAVGEPLGADSVSEDPIAEMVDVDTSHLQLDPLPIHPEESDMSDEMDEAG